MHLNRPPLWITVFALLSIRKFHSFFLLIKVFQTLAVRKPISNSLKTQRAKRVWWTFLAVSHLNTKFVLRMIILKFRIGFCFSCARRHLFASFCRSRSWASLPGPPDSRALHLAIVSAVDSTTRCYRSKCAWAWLGSWECTWRPPGPGGLLSGHSIYFDPNISGFGAGSYAKTNPNRVSSLGALAVGLEAIRGGWMVCRWFVEQTTRTG